jgi:ribosome-associated protein
LDEDEDNAQDSGERPSRSARKRHAEALQKLGVRLTQLRAPLLQKLQLPTELLEAIFEPQRLRSRAALARQRQYIGRLMRDVDPEVLDRALAQFEDTRDAKISR